MQVSPEGQAAGPETYSMWLNNVHRLLAYHRPDVAPSDLDPNASWQAYHQGTTPQDFVTRDALVLRRTTSIASPVGVEVTGVNGACLPPIDYPWDPGVREARRAQAQPRSRRLIPLAVAVLAGGLGVAFFGIRAVRQDIDYGQSLGGALEESHYVPTETFSESASRDLPTETRLPTSPPALGRDGTEFAGQSGDAVLPSYGQGGGYVQESPPPREPTINLFTGRPWAFEGVAHVALSWSLSDATSATLTVGNATEQIDPGSGIGKEIVVPMGSTQITLTAVGAGGQEVSQTITAEVSVGAAEPTIRG